MVDRELIFSRIAETLLIDYVNIFYVDMITNAYYWYYVDPSYHSLNVETTGTDFFAATQKNLEQIVYEEDRPKMREYLRKERLQEEIARGEMEDIVYRLLLDGRPVYHKMRLIRVNKDTENYLILGIMNVDDEIRG
ncbi:MAG: hypothetical protein IKM88_14345, partial [Lachnospiraceae bacterium]|nr:hypothetical protein [Lachnospiraceae bacterium]